MSYYDLEELENVWELDGFLGKLRQGIFDKEAYNSFTLTLGKTHFDDDESIPSRVVTLLWYICPFMEWQKEQITYEISKDEYESAIAYVTGHLERILGIP